jgi:hypothetical protein
VAAPIEQKYAASGPWTVVEDVTESPCDSFGNKCSLFYPDLKASDLTHPIITWANGTFASPEQYAYFLRHLASWGFVVIATQELNTLNNGAGQTIIDAAQLLVRANSDEKLLKGVFYKKLNVDQVGAMGHSQGAAAAIVALMQSNGLIKTVVPIELVWRKWCSGNCIDIKCINPTQICFEIGKFQNGSIFLVSGFEDPISPPEQLDGDVGLQSVKAYFKALPDNVYKARGSIVGSSHNDIQGQPDCGATRIFLCNRGVYGYLGYPTAWMVFQLQGDKSAAFDDEMGGQWWEWLSVDSHTPPK